MTASDSPSGARGSELARLRAELFELVEQLATRCVAPIAVLEATGRVPTIVVGLGDEELGEVVELVGPLGAAGPLARVVADLAQHDQLADHPLVAGASGLRSLLGTGLVDDDGGSIGALAVLHPDVNAFDESHCIAIEAAAARVGTLLAGVPVDQIAAQSEPRADDGARRDLLSNLYHELRPPAQSVIGMTELLAATELTEDQEQYVEIAYNAARTLLDGIEALLAQPCAEASADVIEAQPVQLVPFVESTVELVSYSAYAKGVGLAIGVDAGLPPFVAIDERGVRQVLLALLDRAVERTSRGHVEVEVEARDARLAISIHDGGDPLAATELRTLFGTDACELGELATDLSAAGRAVARMGGTIMADDDGSTVRFEVALVAAQVPAHEPAAEATDVDAELLQRLRAIAPKRILLVEDASNNRFFVTAFLRGLPHEVVEAVDGEEAIEMYEADGPFDLILMDMQMPTLDGYTATEVIRGLEQAGFAGRTPIVALTGDTTPADRARAFEVGCDEHLPKPVLRTTLLDTVARHLTAGEVSGSSSDEPRSKPAAGPPPAEKLARAQAEAADELAALKPTFLRDGRARLLELMTASSASDFEAVARIGREVSAQGDERGFRALCAIGADIEAAALRGDGAGVREAVGRLALGLRSLQRFDY